MKRPLVKQTSLRWFGGCSVETDEEKLQRLLFSEHGQQQDHKAAAEDCTHRALRKGKGRCSRKASRGFCRAPGISVAVIPSPALSGAICLRKAARVPHQSALDSFQGSQHSRQLLPLAAGWRVPGGAARGRRGVETPPGPHTPDTRVPAKTSPERSRWGQPPRPVPELLGDVLQHQRTSPRNAITSLFCWKERFKVKKRATFQVLKVPLSSSPHPHPFPLLFSEGKKQKTLALKESKGSSQQEEPKEGEGTSFVPTTRFPAHLPGNCF